VGCGYVSGACRVRVGGSAAVEASDWRIMSKRFVPVQSVVTVDKKGRMRRFQADHKQRDGTLGYTEAEVAGVSLGLFRVVEVDPGDGDVGVEQATAAPGEKRAARPRKKTGDKS
jgi:hypothetical protein